MPDAKKYAALKAVGLCTSCGLFPKAAGTLKCADCNYKYNYLTNLKLSLKSQTRVGLKGHINEWQLREIEAGQKWAKDHPIKSKTEVVT